MDALRAGGFLKTAASETPAALAARQREHRLRERVRPAEPLSLIADPWLVADEALDALDRAVRALHPGSRALADLELASEKIKQLAWGPSD